MKRLLSILLIILMMFSLIGCGKKDTTVKLGETTSIGDFKATVVSVNKGSSRITTYNDDFWLPIEDKPTYFDGGIELRNSGENAPSGKKYVVATVELQYEGKADAKILFNKSFELLCEGDYSFRQEKAYITTGKNLSISAIGINWDEVAHSDGGKYYTFETMNDQVYTLRICFEVPQKVVDENMDLKLVITMDEKSQTFNLQ